jgi:hypothetical protein
MRTVAWYCGDDPSLPAKRSEAKRSEAIQEGRTALDCFVASLLAMTSQPEAEQFMSFEPN